MVTIKQLTEEVVEKANSMSIDILLQALENSNKEFERCPKEWALDIYRSSKIRLHHLKKQLRESGGDEYFRFGYSSLYIKCYTQTNNCDELRRIYYGRECKCGTCKQTARVPG